MELTLRQKGIWLADREDFDAAHGLLREWLRTHAEDLYASWLCAWMVARHGVHASPDAGDDDSSDERGTAQDIDLFRLANRFMWEQRFANAAEVLEPLCARRQSWPMAWMLLSNCHEILGDGASARAALLGALEADSSYLIALDRLGEIDRAAGRFDALEWISQRAAAVRDELPRFTFHGQDESLRKIAGYAEIAANVAKIVSLLRAGGARDALLPVWRLMDETPEQLPPVRLMAYAAHHSGQLALVRRQLLPDSGEQESQHQNEPSAARLYLEGLLAWYADEDDAALEALTRASETTDHPLIHFAHGLALTTLERNAEAESPLRAAIESAPWLTRARWELADLLLDRREFAQVVEVTSIDDAAREHALRWEPTGLADLAAIERLALTAMLRLGNVAAATERMSADATDAPLLVRQAIVHAANGNLSPAASTLDESLRRDPLAWYVEPEDLPELQRIGTHGAQLVTALAIARNDSIAEGHALLRALLERDPHHLPTVCLNAIAAAHDDMDDEALRLCEAVVQALPEPPGSVVDTYVRLLFERKDVAGLLSLSERIPRAVDPLRAAQTLLEDTGDERLLSIGEELVRRGYYHPVTAKRLAYGAPPQERVMRQLDALAAAVPILSPVRSAAARTALELGDVAGARDRFERLVADGGQPRDSELFAYALAFSQVAAARPGAQAGLRRRAG